jgi:two-component system nitrogen regulation sensor histidine kinase NtrY
MKLPVKITLILFFTLSVFILITTRFFASEIDKSFQRQTEARLNQNGAFIEQRIALLKDNLQADLQNLSESLFHQDEATLTSLLAKPPEFSTDVVGFAEKLRQRTSLDFLSLISSDGIILSSSSVPAAFGTSDRYPDFPLDQAELIFDEGSRLELRKEAIFGRRSVVLRGGYFLKPQLQKIPLEDFEVQERNPSGPAFENASAAGRLTRIQMLQDYKNQPIVRLTFRVSDRDFMEQRRRLIHNGITMGAVALGMSLLTGFLLSLWISLPVARLRDAAVHLSTGDLSVRVEEGSAGGEIGDLVRSFNSMASQLSENQEKLLQTQKIAAWQEIARHLAHEIKNPLTPIQTSITNLRLCMDKAPERFGEIFKESSQSIIEEVEKLRHLANEFSRFARLPAPVMKMADLNEVLQRALLLYQDSPNPLRFEPGQLPAFSFDPEQISQVIHNLVQNAMDAVADSKGEILICSGVTRDGADRSVAFFSVLDNGKGMDSKTREVAFAPYFTTKDKGTGLGLAIVHRIVTEHHGAILVNSNPGEGTKIEVQLPLH